MIHGKQQIRNRENGVADSHAVFFSERRRIAGTIRFFDLFSGIGGFREGLKRAGGFECVGHCEMDSYADTNYRGMV